MGNNKLKELREEILLITLDDKSTVPFEKLESYFYLNNNKSINKNFLDYLKNQKNNLLVKRETLENKLNNLNEYLLKIKI